MSKSKKLFIGVVIVGVIVVGVFLLTNKQKNNKAMRVEEIKPVIGDIELVVTTTGVIEPQNRLEIKPSIAGRIEDILVNEGDRIKKGEVLAWMSSTERAALVDAAGFNSEQDRQYWEEVYKKTPIVSPIDGDVIVRSVEPGQTVTTSDPVLVLSDRLIVSAQFDETDIARVKKGQSARITLDAYPQEAIEGVVDHIAYESELVNNVTIYDVDIVPKTVPEFFRSGMSVTVSVIEKQQRQVVLIPVEAVIQNNTETFVMVKNRSGQGANKRLIETGLSDGENVEVVAGLSSADIVVVDNKAYALESKDIGGSPFMPFSRKRNDKNK